MGVQENFKRATVEMLLLALLTEQDMYGYQLCQELAARSNGKFILQEGSMYPILYRLSQKNLVSTRKDIVKKKRPRVYYHIEPEGIAYLKEYISEYRMIQQGAFGVLNSVQDAMDTAFELTPNDVGTNETGAISFDGTNHFVNV